MTWEEACHTLGVPEKATAAEIKERYLFLLQMLHPDKNMDKPERIRLQAQDEFVRVKEAYEFLVSSDAPSPELPPKMQITPTSIRFKDLDAGEKKATTIDISSAGGPYTNFWVDNSPAPWLRVSDVVSTTAEPLPLQITIEATGIPEPGEQQRCSLRVRLTNERSGLADEVSIDIEATLRLSAPRIRVRNDEIVFTNIPPASRSHDILEIENNSKSVLQGKISTEAAWLSVSPNRFRIRGGSLGRFNVLVSTENLGYDFTELSYINLKTNGGDLSVPVNLSTARRPLPPKKRGGCFTLFIILLLVLLAAFVIWLVVYSGQCSFA